MTWLKRLRACGIAVPVKVGMAGPTSLTALLRYAKRCGVNASLRGLASGAGAGLIGNVGPDAIVAALDVTPASARPARIIFPSAGSCRPPATHAMRRRDELPPAMPMARSIAHDPEKWEPVFGQDHAQGKMTA